MEEIDTSEIEKLHIPVLEMEVLNGLKPRANGHYLDGTEGLGGHTEAILKAAPDCEVCGLDKDGEALDLAKKRLAPYGKRVHLFQLDFGNFELALKELGWKEIDGALLDLGVSSLQLDSGYRGFSFREDGPLDMRMDQKGSGKRAWDLVNRGTFEELRNVLSMYGEDPQASRIAKHILSARQKKSIDTTNELAELVYKAYPLAWRATARKHPATRVFQALRMAVNDEAGQLHAFLDHIWRWIAPDGRLAIISFHSLEDRMVKHAMRKWATLDKDERGCKIKGSANGYLITKKPLIPLSGEIQKNPRSSSAKLRIIEKAGYSHDFA